MVWTEFWDMHSGGGLKTDYHYIYIEAPQDQAEIIFAEIFHRNPNYVTCNCCGEDFSIDEKGEGEDLDEITTFHRRNSGKSVSEFFNSGEAIAFHRGTCLEEQKAQLALEG